jgi:hypothetical protein
MNKDKSALTDLLSEFHATCSGQGDINAGTNLLVAKAVTLANLSRTGCGIEPPKLDRLKAGCSLLINGGLSASFASEVVGQVALRQNVLVAQIERMIRDKYEEAGKKELTAFEFLSGPGSNGSENALFRLEQKDSMVSFESLEEWANVLRYPPNPRIDDLAANPKLLVTARGPGDLEKQLRRLHGNRPLIWLSLKDSKEASSYATLCDALLNGPYPVGEFGETVETNLIVTDPGDALSRIAIQADERAAWVGRTIWLVDGPLGPDASEHAPMPGKFHASETGARFGEALLAVLARRLNNRDPRTVLHPFDLMAAQIRWVAYLKGMEGRLPGITGTARTLLATLAVGLIELANAPDCQRLTVTPAGVEALGRWIIQRMANARVAVMKTTEREQKIQLAQRVLWKLSNDRMSKRDICRALTLAVARIEEVLSVLEPAGLVRQVNGNWERPSQQPILETDLETLFLDA